jgi:bifunctional non-homologous end joining protein LigD
VPEATLSLRDSGRQLVFRPDIPCNGTNGAFNGAKRPPGGSARPVLEAYSPLVLLDGPIAPMLCSPGRTLPAGDDWVLEPKWDGIRAIAHVTEQGVRLCTRRGRSHHHRFPRINAALAELPPGTVLDGELACLQPLKDGRVRCRFDRVSAFMVARQPHRPAADGLTATLVVFDTLAVAGVDLRTAPWSERRARLEEQLGDAHGAVRLTPVLELNPSLHIALVLDGWEGTVAKRTTGRYRCGHRSSSWVKLKSPAARDRDRRRFLASLAA